MRPQSPDNQVLIKTTFLFREGDVRRVFGIVGWNLLPVFHCHRGNVLPSESLNGKTAEAELERNLIFHCDITITVLDCSLENPKITVWSGKEVQMGFQTKTNRTVYRHSLAQSVYEARQVSHVPGRVLIWS